MAKIIIDIAENIKKQIDDGKGETELGIPLWLAYSISKGIPLPKGHGKLIDSNVLWDAFQDLGQDFYEAFDFAEANAVIEADEDGQDGR